MSTKIIIWTFQLVSDYQKTTVAATLRVKENKVKNITVQLQNTETDEIPYSDHE